MKSPLQYLIIVFSGIYLPAHCVGQQMSKKNYSLINPVPVTQMREMETDRPDVTESPFTVDAGHFQFETDLIKVVKEKTESQQMSTVLINHANLKIGITGSTAIQIGFQSYGKQQEKEIASGARVTKEGYGDLTFRIKQNLIGNNSGNFALALLPYVKIPTSKFEDNSRLEGGLILPAQYKLPGGWKLGWQIQVDRLKDEDGQAMHTEFLQSLNISHSLLKGVDGIAETYYTYDFKAHQWLNFINTAVQMEIAKNLKLDAGLNHGIQHMAERQYFIGASYRL